MDQILNLLIKNSRDYNFPIKIELIISNNIKCQWNKNCKEALYSLQIFPHQNHKNYLKEIVYLK